MGYIKEPEGINFVVENKGLSEADRLLMNQIIAAYKTKKVRKTAPTNVQKGAIKSKKEKLAV